MKKCFCGWYHRCQSETQTLAIIPSIHKTSRNAFCNIQILTDTGAFRTSFPYSDFNRNIRGISIGRNLFGNDGFTLDIQTPGLQVSGDLHFGDFSSIKYDIMGPFRYIPFLQCKHSVFSMKHAVAGELIINGAYYHFQTLLVIWKVTGAGHFPASMPRPNAFFQADL